MVQKYVEKKSEHLQGKKKKKHKSKVHINIQLFCGDNVLCSLCSENKCIFQDT